MGRVLDRAGRYLAEDLVFPAFPARQDVAQVSDAGNECSHGNGEALELVLPGSQLVILVGQAESRLAW